MVTKKTTASHRTLKTPELEKHLKRYHTTKQESPIKRYWRPAMAWQYFTVCLYDFLFAPMIHQYIQLNVPGETIPQWVPLTLQGGGLYHVAMGAMVGIYAWTRSLEKIKLMDNGIIPKAPDETLTTETDSTGEDL
jgi:hypothetical protein